MSKYDSMSFKELVQETINHSCNDLLLPPDDWLDMMRRAVIREATVGEVEVKVRESEDELTAPKGDPDRVVTMTEQIVSRAWVPEGEYLLVKKEG